MASSWMYTTFPQRNEITSAYHLHQSFAFSMKRIGNNQCCQHSTCLMTWDVWLQCCVCLFVCFFLFQTDLVAFWEQFSMQPWWYHLAHNSESNTEWLIFVFFFIMFLRWHSHKAAPVWSVLCFENCCTCTYQLTICEANMAWLPNHVCTQMNNFLLYIHAYVHKNR